MEKAEDQILSFCRLLCTYQGDLEVKQLNESPIIFEIKVRKEEVAEIRKYLGVLQAIAAHASGLMCDQFEMIILGK